MVSGKLEILPDDPQSYRVTQLFCHHIVHVLILNLLSPPPLFFSNLYSDSILWNLFQFLFLPHLPIQSPNFIPSAFATWLALISSFLILLPIYQTKSFVSYSQTMAITAFSFYSPIYSTNCYQVDFLQLDYVAPCSKIFNAFTAQSPFSWPKKQMMFNLAPYCFF